MTDAPAHGDERPVELPPDTPSTFGVWALVSAGPVVWAVHFLVVYLLAEAACAALETDEMRFIGSGALVATVIAATVVAAVACLAAAGYSWRRSRTGRGDVAHLGFAGTLLALGSFAAVLVVGLPASVLDPC